MQPGHLRDRYERNAGRRPNSVLLSDAPGTFASGIISPADDNHQNWTRHITPEGFPYFMSFDKHFVTDTHISRSGLFSQVLQCESTLRHTIQALHDEDPESIAWLDHDWEAVIRVQEDGGCLYYMIDYDLERVFWLDKVNEWEEFELDDDLPETLLQLFIQKEFWAHVELFPHRLPRKAAANVKEMLLYARIDTATAPGSTSPYSAEQCTLFLDTLDGLSDCPDPSPVKVHVIARLTYKLYCNRYDIRFGEDGALLDRTQPIFTTQQSETSLGLRFCFIALRLIVFGLEVPQLRKIREVVVHDVVLPHLWHSFLADFVRNIEQSNIVAALIFTANIGFLAISGLTELESTAILISTLFSLASLLIGLYHVRQHSGFVTLDGGTGADYFGNAHYVWSGWGGYHLLAVLHCLPLALLIWSVLVFGVTVVIYAQQTVTSWARGLFLTATVLMTLVPGFTFWYFWSLGEPLPSESPREIRLVSLSNRAVVFMSAKINSMLGRSLAEGSEV